MSQVVIHNLDPRTLHWLQVRAKTNGRSVQDEVKDILEHAAVLTTGDAWAASAAIRKRLEGRTHSDSGDLQAEDRER